MLRDCVGGRRLRFALAALAAVLLHGVASAADLAVCIDKASPSAAVDARFAAALARAEGASLRVHEFDGRGDDDFSLHDFKGLLEASCRLVIGFPQAAGAAALPRYLKATPAYARTGFVLVTRGDAAYASLAAMPQGTRVGVAYDTLPNVYFRHHPNVVREIFEDAAAALAAVGDGRVGGAMLWRASIAPRLAPGATARALRLQAIDEAGSQWDLVALHRSDDDDTARRFGAALEQLRADGRLAKLFDGYAEVAARRPGTHRSLVQRSAAAPAPRCASKPKAPPALFTDAQAGEGKELYASKCAFCHAPDLTGRAGPALKGKFFAAPSHKYKVSDIFAIVSRNMPATQPGSLSQDEYVRIMAYILQQNGYPAGDTALTFEAANGSKTPLRYYGD